jgi:glycosyltransferase involved in cell wall biosynthesis
MVGYIVEAWHDSGRAPKMRVLDTRGAGHILFSPWHFIRCLFQIARMRKRFPLLHVHVAGRGSTIRKIFLVHFSRLLGLSIVLHLHDYNYRDALDRFPALIRMIIPSIFRSVGAVVVLGEGDRLLVVDRLGVDPARVNIVPNAVPAPLEVRRLSDATSPVQIAFLGNPSRRKGLHDLIAALATTPLRRLDWRLTVAGGGNEVADFQRQVTAAKLSDQIIFTGWIDRQQTAALLQSADILVLPSYAEGMAMSVLEGMSHGLCVICTPVGSLKYVINNQMNGLLVQPGNVSQLAHALVTAIGDVALRNRLGLEANKTFRQKFNAAHLPNVLEPIYAAALQSRT